MKYKSQFYYLPEAMFKVDLDMRITSVTHVFELLVNKSKGRIIGKRCRDILKSPSCYMCRLKNLMEENSNIPNLEVIEWVSLGGRQELVRMNVSSIRNKEDKVIGGIGSFRTLHYREDAKITMVKEEIFEGMASRSPAMHKIFEEIRRCAEWDSNVLILGKTGTGKELAARAIHNLSKQKEKEFVIIDIAAITGTLLESELFGYRKGAFTGANAHKTGRFEMADGGTVLLDEIGDLPHDMQVKILRAIEEKVITPVGSNKPIMVDVRIIASTNKDLGKMVKEGKFRDDLFFRLSNNKIELPALSERKRDIPLLIQYFIEQLNSEHDKKIGISPEAMKLFEKHDYTGNIRELKNLVTASYNSCKGDIILFENLPIELLSGLSLPDFFDPDEFMTLKDRAREHIFNVMISCNMDYGKAAKILGISARSLRRKAEGYGFVGMQ